MGRWANKYVIGLTGNIAMGKSLVRTMLQHKGAYTIDADGLAHQVMAPNAPAYKPVIDTFGKWILDKDGRVDRTKLGAVAFSHPEALARLEALTHPIVGQGIDTLINMAKQPIVVVEAIKLVDGVLGAQVDAVWVVDAAPQVQLERLIKNRQMTEYEARKRVDTQNPQRDKLAKATVVITNNGTMEDVWVQVEREWARIVQTLGVGAKVAEPEVTSRAISAQAQQRAQAAAPVATPTPVAPSPVAPAQPPKVATGTAPQVPVVPPSPVPQPIAQPTPPPVAQPRPTPQPTPVPQPIAQPTPPPVPQVDYSKLDIRRGMPKNAEEIAQIINQALGKRLTRMDIMMAFGQKSYMLAEASGKTLGLAGFQVENLITRMDEFIVMPGAPIPVVAEALIGEVEDASKALQSEVGFMFLPGDATPALVQAFVDQGYEKTALESIKVPAWREAAAESQPPGTQIMSKKLSDRRVLKPI
jgi:dephospho-CoA kinase